MTTTLFNAVQASNNHYTANGAVTLGSSLDPLVDLFFVFGSSRSRDLTAMLNSALSTNAELTARMLLWVRDVRGGAGERQQFRKYWLQLVSQRQDLALAVLKKIPMVGRWDDVLIAFGTPLERDALRMISAALAAEDGLCAKWLPRQGADANKIRSYLKLPPKNYRRLIVGLSNTVEQKMCARQFSEINYNYVPSMAALRYQAAFKRNDEERYSDYVNKLAKGDEDVKINASSVFPHDILHAIKMNSSVGTESLDAQWKALPDYIAGADVGAGILPVVDVSSSMMTPIGHKSSVSVLTVAVALGLYVSERISGPFKNQFVSFTDYPQMFKLTDSNVTNRYNEFVKKAVVGYSTNFVSVFDTLLKAAQRFNVPADQMPKTILALSDMEFNECGPFTSFEYVKRAYEQAGYPLPKLVFWNLNGRPNNVPTPSTEKNIALVSGFSPSIMKSVLSGEEITPTSVMMSALMQERYNLN